MEFIESCDVIHRKLSLTCLSQLVENPKTATYFDDWNSIKTMRNSTGLLVKLYEEEENKYNVEYLDGVLQNLERPLNPRPNQKMQNKTSSLKLLTEEEDSQDRARPLALSQKPAGLSSTGERPNSQLTMKGDQTKKGFSKLKDALQATEADSEVGAEAYLIRMLREKTRKFDLRGIIFAILYRTSFDKNDLAPEEKQRIEMIQIFPQIRIGEIWTEINEELEKEVASF